MFTAKKKYKIKNEKREKFIYTKLFESILE